MNMEYLSTLPEVINEYNVKLQDGEKVIFTAKLSTFGTEKDRILGLESKFTLTNKRIFANNGVGLWTIDIAEEIASCEKISSGWLIFKSTYFSVTLNSEMVFDDGKQILTGFHFYFNPKDIEKFEEITNNLFN